MIQQFLVPLGLLWVLWFQPQVDMLEEGKMVRQRREWHILYTDLLTEEICLEVLRGLPERTFDLQTMIMHPPRLRCLPAGVHPEKA